ncbi:MAG: hypothetical protein Q9210_002617 [Variospora velana]
MLVLPHAPIDVVRLLCTAIDYSIRDFFPALACTYEMPMQTLVDTAADENPISPDVVQKLNLELLKTVKIHNHTNMIRRTLLRHAQTVKQIHPVCISRSASILHTPSRRISSSLPAWISPRYYSAAPETAASTDPAQASSEAQGEEDPVKKELDSKNREIIDLKDRYLRSVADFRNLQDRTKRDVQSARDFAIQKFAADLIESVDNLDRALTTVPASKLAPQSSDPDTPADENTYNKDLAYLYDGLKMTETILMGTLKKHGLERFDPSEGEGQPFNPNLHEATFQTKVEGKEDGQVFMTQQKGFTLNGRVLRAAKVGVVKNS